MRRSVMSLCTLLALDCAFAGDKPESGPVPAWVTSISAPTSDGTSSDAPVKLLLSDWQANFSTGSVDAYFHSVMLVQTSQGLVSAGTISVPWNPATDSLIVHRVLILRGAKTIDVLENGPGFTVLRRENSLEYATLNGVLTAVIQPPGLQVGDRIDLAFTLRRVTPIMTADSEFVFSGWPSMPIGLMSVRARWTAPTTMRWLASDVMPKLHEARRGDTTEVSFELRNPAVVVQPNGAPARFRLGRQLQFSSFSSWQKISAQFAPMYVQAAKLGPQSPLRDEANRIRTAHADRAGQALAALALVQDQVRYVFLGMNEGALVPADADLTWSRRFGDCKGKTALLLALLHELGIDAEPVAVSVAAGDAVDRGLPMIEAFDHVLVRVKLDGQTYWLDGARSGDRQLEDLGAPPYQWGLPFVPGGNGLVQIVAAPLAQPLEEDLISIDASRGIPGPAAMHSELVFRGQTGAVMRFAIGSVSVEERDRALRAIFTKSYPTASIDKIAAHFDEQTAQELVTVDGSLPLEWSGEHLKLEGLRLRYQADFERTPGPHRDAPYSVPFPLYSRIRETIKLPHTEQPFTVEGENIHRTVAGIEFTREAHVEKGVLTAMASARSMDTEIPFSSATIAQKVLPELTESDVYLHTPSEPGGAQPEVTRPAAAEAPAQPLPEASAEPPVAPATAQELISRGTQLLDKQQYDQAIEQFDAALRLEPRSPWALADRGMAEMWKNQPERAARDFDAAAAADPGNAVVWSGRGMLALRAGKFETAIADFTEALKAQPGSSFSLQWRAEAYRRQGDLEKALTDSAAVIHVYPQFLGEYAFRAQVLRQLGRSAEAAQEAEDMVAANEKDYRAYVAAAVIYRASGKNAQALQSLDDSLSLKEAANTFLVRAAYRPKSDLDGRLSDIDAAMKLEPKSAAALFALANAQSDAGEFAKAEATLTQGLATLGELPWLLSSRAIVYTKNSRRDLAEKDLAAARAKSTRPQELNNLCWSLATANVALDTALSACQQAVALEPAVSAYQDSLGFVLLRLGRYGESIAAYDLALKEYAEHTMSLYGRGMARHLNGDTAGGEADIQAALRMDAHVATVYADYGLKP
jgi:tetratricopeptide (TPR) repeat protein